MPLQTSASTGRAVGAWAMLAWGPGAARLDTGAAVVVAGAAVDRLEADNDVLAGATLEAGTVTEAGVGVAAALTGAAVGVA